MRKIVSLALASLGLAAATPSMAATIYLNGGATQNNGGAVFTNSDVTVRATGWSVNNHGVISKGNIGVYSQGLGVINSSSDGSHTVDNVGWTDFLVLQFDQAVELDKALFKTGFHGMNDTDSTIGFALSGLGIGTDLNLAGMNSSALSSFNLFDSNASNGNSFRNINAGSNVGNVWLIASSFTNQDHRADGYKLKKLTYTVTPVVPEPGTWLMMILGFGLIGGAMRQKKTGRTVAAA